MGRVTTGIPEFSIVLPPRTVPPEERFLKKQLPSWAAESFKILEQDHDVFEDEVVVRFEAVAHISRSALEDFERDGLPRVPRAARGRARNPETGEWDAEFQTGVTLPVTPVLDEPDDEADVFAPAPSADGPTTSEK